MGLTGLGGGTALSTTGAGVGSGFLTSSTGAYYLHQINIINERIHQHYTLLQTIARQTYSLDFRLQLSNKAAGLGRDGCGRRLTTLGGSRSGYVAQCRTSAFKLWQLGLLRLLLLLNWLLNISGNSGSLLFLLYLLVLLLGRNRLLRLILMFNNFLLVNRYLWRMLNLGFLLDDSLVDRLRLLNLTGDRG
jgi:hypothetical protein